MCSPLKWRPLILASLIWIASNTSDGQERSEPSLKPHSSSPRAYRVQNSDVTLSYRVFGQGPPVLIINGGFGTDSVGFEGLAQELSAAHQTILFDRRGVGQSTMKTIDQRTMTMDLLVEDLEVIRRELKLTSWSILGHSFGGMLAAHYTATHPSRVDKLILSSSAGVDLTLFSTDNRVPIHAQLSEEDRTRLKSLEAQYHLGDHSAQLLERFSEILARAYVVNDALSPWVARRLRSANKRVGALLSEDLKQTQFDAKPALKTFKRPVLIIQGQRDIMIEEIAQVTLEALPHAHLKVLAECGHYGWLDQPQKYFSAVFSFLAQ